MRARSVQLNVFESTFLVEHCNQLSPYRERKPDLAKMEDSQSSDGFSLALARSLEDGSVGDSFRKYRFVKHIINVLFK